MSEKEVQCKRCNDTKWVLIFSLGDPEYDPCPECVGKLPKMFIGETLD